MTTLVRPQRQLTEAEWEVVRGTTLLRLHAALPLGIVGPVPNPSLMPEAAGARVHERPVRLRHFGSTLASPTQSIDRRSGQ